MSEPPAFLDSNRPDVPDIVVARGVAPFHLPGRPVRGRLVRLGALADALLTRHENHPAVTMLSGEALALTAALSTALKFRGWFSLQAKGNGPISMLLSDCTESGALRGYARAVDERLAAVLAKSPAPTARELLGDGYLAFTVDQGGAMERHQGIVAIEGDTLADMALHYFETSEQILCMVRLACGRVEGGWRASAIILERVAGEGGIDPGLSSEEQDEAWRTAVALFSTIRDAELLDDTLPPERLLHNLFGSEGVVMARNRALAYGCRCSRARLSGILEGFSSSDLDHMVVDGNIVMTCEFCNLGFQFGRDEVRGMASSQKED